MRRSVFVCVLLALFGCIHDADFVAVGVGTKPLVIKTFPGVENLQSDLYEVYMEPYAYDLRAASAVAVITGEGKSPIKGELIFAQRHPPGGPVTITGTITGLTPGKHGLHIHQAGDLRQGCGKVGGHFNPYLLQHGAPKDSLRHVGDLGNIEVGKDGTATVKMVDNVASLLGGQRGIAGRAIVISEGEDDFGKGGTSDSAESGSSGKAIACGVIAYTI